MEEPGFDPGDFYAFDLAHGAVRTRGGVRVLVLSDDVVAPLVSAAVQKGDLSALRRLGQQMAAQAATSLGPSVGDLPPETVLGHISSCMALFGFGRVRLESWGPALVATVDGAPDLDSERLAMGAVLGGLLSTLVGREVACVPVGRRGELVVVDPGVAQTVLGWSKQGADVPSVVARLVGAT